MELVVAAILGAVLFIAGSAVGYVFGVMAGRAEAASQWREVQANLIRDSQNPEGA